MATASSKTQIHFFQCAQVFFLFYKFDWLVFINFEYNLLPQCLLDWIRQLWSTRAGWTCYTLQFDLQYCRAYLHFGSWYPWVSWFSEDLWLFITHSQFSHSCRPKLHDNSLALYDFVSIFVSLHVCTSEWHSVTKVVCKHPMQSCEDAVGLANK